MNKVLESTKLVVENSNHVRIRKERLKEVSEKLDLSKIKFWLDDLPFFQKLEIQQKLNFIFIISSLAFCFWGDPKWTIEYEGKNYDGAWGLLMAFKRAIENKFPILEVKYLAEIPRNDLKAIFKGNVEIPLFEERLKIVREIGQVLVQKYNDLFENVIQEANGDVLKLLDSVITNFPFFNDLAIYNGNKVYFYKKAQLVIADVYHSFKDQGLSNFKNIDQLTALADYKLPQVLRKLGILEYSSDLAEKVDNKILIPQGSKEEIEIRANTIWAVELIKNELKNKYPNITAKDIDSYLWFLGQKKSPDDKPYHLTKTTFY